MKLMAFSSFDILRPHLVHTNSWGTKLWFQGHILNNSITYAFYDKRIRYVSPLR